MALRYRNLRSEWAGPFCKGVSWNTLCGSGSFRSEDTVQLGEDDEATDSPANFNNKSVWARISVIAAGPVFNFILAFVCAIVLIAFVGYDEPVIGSLDEGYPAQEAGLQPGDRIVGINGKNIHLFREVKTYNQFHQGKKWRLSLKGTE